MHTTTNSASNGRMRKSLASQLDRLDGILDGLSEGLTEAVATAVQEAVQGAVHLVLTELLTQPQLLAHMYAAVNPSDATAPESAKPSGRLRFRSWVMQMGQRLRQRWQALRQGCRRSWQWVRQSFTAGVGAVIRPMQNGLAWYRLLRDWRAPLLSALTVGMIAGALTVVAGPWLAPLASGVGAFAMTLSIHLGLWLRRMACLAPFVRA